ncbi:hypothetical protein GIB67_035040 [Kingdonia uniflora]|uniref:Pentatricopeptide repeat-containing protein n=1 Tax=Kingdonia uniflora TaxID=39325 RepID=A0A7J7L1I3_9MAGN|nr:hypothetical protein GIB67_035040 [Kingdonia uniflora]
MDSKLLSIYKRLSSNLKWTSQTTRSSMSTTTTTATNKKKKSKPSNSIPNKALIPKMNRKLRHFLFSECLPFPFNNQSLIPILDKWDKENKGMTKFDLKGLIYKLRGRSRFTQALEVSEWVDKKGVFRFLPGDHAVQLDLIARVRGLDSAESYFCNLSDEDKTQKIYGTLCNCYRREGLTDKYMSLRQKMKEMGFVSTLLDYKNLMSFYASSNEHEKVHEVFSQMKDSGVSPDSFSYEVCINSYGGRSDVDGMERLLEEIENRTDISMKWRTYSVMANNYIKLGLSAKAVAMLKKQEEKLNSKDGVGYNYLMSAYGRLGNKTELMRVWELVKVTFKGYKSRDYATIVGAYARLGELEEAEKLLKEWASSITKYDFQVANVILMRYIERGLIERAETVLQDLVTTVMFSSPASWAILASGYEQKDEMENATRCMKNALQQHESGKWWLPDAKLIGLILSWLGHNGEIEEVETFVGYLKAVIPVNRDMYHALIKASIRGGKEVDGILESMKADEIDEDEETKKILCFNETKPDEVCEL